MGNNCVLIYGISSSSIVRQLYQSGKSEGNIALEEGVAENSEIYFNPHLPRSICSLYSIAILLRFVN